MLPFTDLVLVEIDGQDVRTLDPVALRRGIGYVKLTPSGIDIADVRWTRSVSWDDVVAVDDLASPPTQQPG